jgi:hypothetical protein
MNEVSLESPRLFTYFSSIVPQLEHKKCYEYSTGIELCGAQCCCLLLRIWTTLMRAEISGGLLDFCMARGRAYL